MGDHPEAAFIRLWSEEITLLAAAGDEWSHRRRDQPAHSKYSWSPRAQGRIQKNGSAEGTFRFQQCGGRYATPSPRRRRLLLLAHHASRLCSAPPPPSGCTGHAAACGRCAARRRCCSDPVPDTCGKCAPDRRQLHSRPDLHGVPAGVRGTAAASGASGRDCDARAASNVYGAWVLSHQPTTGPLLWCQSRAAPPRLRTLRRPLRAVKSM